MRTRQTRRKRNRRKRSRRIKRGGDSRNTWLPSFAVDMGRNAAHSVGNTMNEIGGRYPGVDPNPLVQNLLTQ